MVSSALSAAVSFLVWAVARVALTQVVLEGQARPLVKPDRKGAVEPSAAAAAAAVACSVAVRRRRSRKRSDFLRRERLYFSSGGSGGGGGGSNLVPAGGSATIGVEAPFVTISYKAAAPAITDLRELVAGLGIHHGIANALDSKLRAALAALEADDTAGACDSMQAFLNQVRAQRGKKLTVAQALQLTAAANEIRAILDC